jgi:hypothetical protein
MSLSPSRPGQFITLLACCVCGRLLFGPLQTAQAAEVRIALQDADSGDPFADAGVEVLLPDGLQPAHTTLGEFSVDQIDKEFVANVTVAPRSSSVILMRSLGASDMMLIAEVMIDTRMQGFEKFEGEWRVLMDAAAASSDGIGDAIITVQGVPYQITVIPLFLPTPVAWIFGGFLFDSRFTATVKQSIVSEVSIVEFTQTSPAGPARCARDRLDAQCGQPAAA